jgi:tetratricopeptide (TPR) repeat protein
MLNTQLSVLESKGLVALTTTDPELEYAFRHPLLHEAVYASLTHADRRSLHRSVGDVLETLYPDRLEDLAPRLADHFSQAGDTPRAFRYYFLAGRAAQRVYANPEAVLHYRQALELVQAGLAEAASPEELADLYLRLGRVLELSSRYDEALAHYHAMEADAAQQGNRRLELAALIARGTVQGTPTVLFDAEEAASASERALALAQELGERAAEAKIYWNLLLLNVFTNDADQALEHGKQSLAIAREYGLREQLGYTLNDLGTFVYFSQGDLANSRRASEEAGEIWRELGNLPMLVDSLINIALNEFIAGHIERSLEISTQAHQIAVSIGNLWGQSYSLGAQASVYVYRGMADQAIPLADNSMRLGMQAGFTAIQSIDLIEKCVLYAILGAVGPGLQAAQKAIQVSYAGFRSWRGLAYAGQAYFQVLGGKLDDAEASLNESKVSGYEPELMLHNPLYMIASAELHLARGEYSTLLGNMKVYLEKLDKYGARAFLPFGHLYHGIALQRSNRIPEARTSFMEGIQLADELQIHPVSWRARALLADLEQANGSLQDAARLLQEARSQAAFLAEHAGLPELKASFLALPEVQKVMRAAA